MFMKACLLIIFCVYFFPVVAQDKLDFGDTKTTTKSPKYKSKKKDFKKKRPVEWVKNSPKGLLIGNPCMETVTKEMGFIYVIQSKIPQSRYGGTRLTDFERFWHNMFAKLRITFKNGPFWKFKLKKKRKECRGLTGDFVG